MKIEHADPARSLIGRPLREAGIGKTEAVFAKVLTRQMEAAAAQPALQPNRLQAAVRPVSGGKAADPEPIQSAELLLGTVEHYRNLLGQSGIQLRAIEPTVEQMRIELAAMDRLMRQLPGNAAVRQVLQDASILVHQEIGRFETGFYVDP